MKLSDAAHILSLTGEVSPEDVKLAYRRAAKIYHPDRNPAGLEMMKMVSSPMAGAMDFGFVVALETLDTEYSTDSYRLHLMS
ncbi:MAG: hypothetical protein ACI9UN_003677 [Granulosicoccus sp.]|jgi:hypothetical protein